jgi:hypothetical protein
MVNQRLRQLREFGASLSQPLATVTPQNPIIEMQMR